MIGGGLRLQNERDARAACAPRVESVAQDSAHKAHAQASTRRAPCVGVGGDALIDADRLRAQIVEIATGFEGACGCAPYREFMTEALGFPIDWRPFRVVNGRVEGVSTCYIFALNVLRRAGVAIHNWHVGEPIGAMIAWARRHECWQDPVDGCVPAAGDVIVIGRESSPHVAVVVDCDGATLESVDGGQVCSRSNAGHDGAGRQAIMRRTRVWGVDMVLGWVDAGRAPLAGRI